MISNSTVFKGADRATFIYEASAQSRMYGDPKQPSEGLLNANNVLKKSGCKALPLCNCNQLLPSSPPPQRFSLGVKLPRCLRTTVYTPSSTVRTNSEYYLVT